MADRYEPELPAGLSVTDPRLGGRQAPLRRLAEGTTFVVYRIAFWNGQTAESIAQSFPTLSLEQVYGAITFYLGHRDEIDRYRAKRRDDFEAARDRARAADPAFTPSSARCAEREDPLSGRRGSQPRQPARRRSP